MKILIQKSSDRDCVGVTNALAVNQEVMLWDPESQDIKDASPDLYIFTDVSKLGKYVFNNINKDAKFLFLKCVQPKEFSVKAISVETLPIAADTIRYPVAIPDKSLYCDVFYLSNFKDRTAELSQINFNNLTFRAAGITALTLPNYIGRLDSPKEMSQMCLSVGVCIDFDLEYALDILKIGGRVITNVENNLDIPVFTQSTLCDVIRDVVNKKKPVLNKYENMILSYSQVVENILKLVG